MGDLRTLCTRCLVEIRLQLLRACPVVQQLLPEVIECGSEKHIQPDIEKRILPLDLINKFELADSVCAIETSLISKARQFSKVQ